MRKNLTYVQEGAPDFMRMLTGQSASSAANNDPRNPYRKPIGIEAKFQSDQPDDDEDDDETAHDILNEREEERPTVVVLKDGKHLDERQVKNILNNLPAGLSEAEIEKRLASALESNNTANKETQEEEESEDDQVPIDAHGKILFRRPKGSKPKSTSSSTTSSSTKSDKSITSTASKKNFENALLAEAEAKVQALKKTQQSGSTSSAGAGAGASEGSKRKASDNTSKDSKDSSSTTNTPKKKKLQKKTTTSLLSFNDDE
ncbi:hypothetical protein BGZ95_004275 [Linnemannia exigua]|uniref:DUF4604 domain-containing protein n=1 Tax=Linnemannia exigua TaxID=604196 RepID=A0AAD4D381_9FUNG|nr:hypothetical protein BGZ95_004275 [Linnemannia exigua]